MAEPTRAARFSILPNRSWGAEAIGESGEFLSIDFQAPLIRSRARRSGSNGFNNLRRQAEAYVFRHHFQFLDIVKALHAQELHRFLDQTLRRRGASGQCDGLYAVQPCGLNVAVAIDE